MNLPKPDDRLKASLHRLRSNADFQEFVRHHEALLKFFTNAIVYASPEDVPPLQGRARQLQELLDLTKGN